MKISKPTIYVAAAVIIKNGQCLITQRFDHAHLAGYWEFPGGKLKKGESAAQGVVRELKEELGVDVTPGVLLYNKEHEYPEKKVNLSFLECVIVKGEPQALDVEQFRWVALDELGLYRFPEADSDLVKTLMKR
jgi:mutator protein MutT